MSKIEEYNRLVAMLNRDLTAMQKELLAQLECQIITEEKIIPAINEVVKPMFAAFHQNMTVVIEYNTEQGVQTKVFCQNDKEWNPLAEEKLEEEDLDEQKLEEVKCENEEPKFTCSKSIGFSVTFPDGTCICHKNAKDTMLETLKKIGLERVSQFKSVNFKGYPLVGRIERSDNGFKWWQKEVDGWFVYINMDNKHKISTLKKTFG